MSNKSSTAAALRADILAANDLKREPLPMPEWNNRTVEVRALGILDYKKVLKECEVDEIIDVDVPDGNGGTITKQKTIKIQDHDRLAILLTIACTHDPESGDKLFSAGDFDILSGKHGKSIGKVAQVALKLCGNDEAEAEKNSEPTPTTGSPSE